MTENGRRKRFGGFAVDLGLITMTDLYEALKWQLEEVFAGAPKRPLGTILVEMGLVTPEQVERIVEIQARS